nr:hypothetical protein [Kibdelosporangium sp. MJ126-NF4]CEL20288.1 hypothetical protein [Kibdelosporangium sp. MJ126-NF4]CTQ97514.1 hypothetical protein [Kibdelosporangium sp. MJ126-NF4]
MSTDREDELIRQIGALAMADGPEGWVRIDLHVQVGYAHRLTILMPDAPGQWLAGTPAPEINPLLRELLSIMEGPWKAMRLIIDPPGSYAVHFLYDRDPADIPWERWVYEQLLFALPPGWQWAQVRHNSGLLNMVTGETVPYTPPEGVVAVGKQVEMRHLGGVRITTENAAATQE